MPASAATIHAKIHAATARLSPSERRIATVLLASYPVAGLETVAQLAARAQVSGATVVRFVRRLGFDGYPAFHQHLLDEVRSSSASPLQLAEARPLPAADDLPGQAQRLFSAGVGQSLERLSADDIAQAVALLADPKRRVLCTGGRVSDLLARYLHEHLSLARPGTEWIAPTPARIDRLIDVERRDVLVVYDFRRYQADTVQFAKACRQRGATVLLVTDPWLSPVAAVSRQVLICEVDGLSLYDSFVPALALTEVLVSATVAALGESARARMTALEGVRGEG